MKCVMASATQRRFIASSLDARVMAGVRPASALGGAEYRCEAQSQLGPLSLSAAQPRAYFRTTCAAHAVVIPGPERSEGARNP
jgi:hypothetical protein